MRSQLSSVKALMLIAAASSLLATVGVSSAAEIASDNAGNYSSSQFDSPIVPNQGSGFQNWYVTITNNNNPPYAGLTLDTSNKSIAVNNNSWGTYGNWGTATNPDSSINPTVNLYRPLLGDNGSGNGSLEVGQTISWAVQSDGITGSNATDVNSAIGVALQNGITSASNPAGGSSVFVFEYGNLPSEGDSALLYDGVGGNHQVSTGITQAQVKAGLKMALTLTSTTSYNFTVDSTTGTQLYIHSGTISAAINQFDLFDINTSGNGYFNSLAVSSPTPEPTSLAMLGAGVLRLLALPRRKRTA